ncbi:MAG: UvrD-helicase domain-containing protein [Planctomycetota bacterium]
MCWTMDDHDAQAESTQRAPAPAAPPADDSAAGLLEKLTEPQHAAVTHTEGPLLVLAAAGSGKTRVITRRIAYLISQGVPPWQVLAVTFTNKAAGEMRERVMHMLNPSGEENSRRTRGLTISTFHSLSARLMRRYAELAEHDGAGLGIKPDFTIYDSSDQQALIKRVIAGLGLSTSNWNPRSVLSAISSEKNKLISADDFAASATDFYAKTVAKLYSGYESALRQANAVDFDDLLLLSVKMLKKSEAVRTECQQRWRYLMIDEYQDTNHAQFQMASLLAGDGHAKANGESQGPNVCVVGDPDQAIYSWRGADISNILDFEEHYPGAHTITLGENFRSTAPILATADRLIRHNQRRKHKDLFTSRDGGDQLRVVLTRDEKHEAQLLADWFRALHDGDDPDQGENTANLKWSDMAVFYRTNALSRSVEDALRAAAVPYVIARGTAFYDREEVKSTLAYLRVVANSADGVSLSRIVNMPTRGLGKTSLGRIDDAARAAGVSLFEALRDAKSIEGVSARAASAAGQFVEMVEGWTGGGTFMGQSVSASLAELVERVIKESGLESMYAAQARASGAEADEDRLDNLGELISSAAEFEQTYDPADDPSAFPGEEAMASGAEVETPPLLALLRAYLERVALVADADAVDPGQGAVTLMTLHAAKGLEFPAVGLVGLEENLLPHSRANESEAELEEERRLCFVGITRAMQHLTITSAKYRTRRGMTERSIPSRFIEEINGPEVALSDQSDTWDDFSQDDGIDADPSHEIDPGERLRRAQAASEARSGKLAEAKQQYPVGSRVRHPQFGVGIIESLAGGASVRIKVRFSDTGTKTLILEYARLTRV